MWTAEWSNGQTSSGTLKTTSTGAAQHYKAVLTVTSGYGFLAGHTTKISAADNEDFTEDGDCSSTDIHQITSVPATTVKFTQT